MGEPRTLNENLDSGYLPLEGARMRIFIVWLAGAVAITSVLVLQSAFGKYQNKVQDVFSWEAPAIMPTLTLISSTLRGDAFRKTAEARVNRNYYRIALWLSVSYLVLILGTILIEPFTPFDPLELLRLSNIWLGFFQGLVASAIGTLFFSRIDSTKGRGSGPKR